MKLYGHAREILRHCDIARTSVVEDDERPPKIRVGALQTLSATDVAAFHTQLVRGHPQWRWTVREGSERSLNEALSNERVDIAWTVVEDDTANARVLWREPYVAMLAKNHPLARRGSSSLRISELNGEPIILRGLTPYEYICKTWTNEPERFRLNPIHQMPGLNT